MNNLPTNTTSRLDQSIIKYLKTFYFDKVDSTKDEKEHYNYEHRKMIANLNSNCFCVCNFVKKEFDTIVTDEHSLSSVKSVEWKRLSQSEENYTIFNNFVHFVNDVDVMAIQTNEDILVSSKEDFFPVMSTNQVASIAYIFL